jgi:hypothetical protein
MDKIDSGNLRLTPFVESFLILCQMNNQIHWALYPPESVGNATDFVGRRDFKNMDDDLKMTICFHVLILVSSFMEEYARLEKLAKTTNDKRLQISLETLEPALHRIKEWDKGLSKVRNFVLAHPFRDGSKKYVTRKVIFADPLVPTNFAQMLAFGKYANLVVQGIAILYPVEAKQCWDWQELEDFKSEPRGIASIGAVEDELKIVNDEIIAKIKVKKLRMGNPVTGEWIS